MGPGLFKLLLCFIQLIFLSSQSSANEYRLPTTYSPSKYAVNLYLDAAIFNGTSSTFEGDVDITFTVSEPTNVIKIHGSVNITTLVLKNETSSDPVNFMYDPITEILTINTTSSLTINTIYVLSITYIGNLDLVNMRGFYRSEYLTALGKKSYLVTTQFQPTHARKAFPCFDEPRYKAKFSISITCPSGLLVLGNTPIQTTDDNSTVQKVEFTETPTMPTYLIAFIVSDFNCTYGADIDTDVPHGVCSTKESIGDRDLAVEYGPKIMHALESMTSLKYKDQGLGKMHQAALPDFSAGAMENWGLVTYRESALLWNKEASSNSYKQRVLTVIAHEFAHMWFGNLVTCDWWDYTFLNEGFARYFQYFSLTKLQEIDANEVWEMAKQFIIEQQQSVFPLDSLKTSMSLTSPSESPSEVSDKFSSISYNKGASVIRMLENVMGSENFFKGLNDYLIAHAYSTTVPIDLWQALAPHLKSDSLPPLVTLVDVMKNWINVSGFPLVTVSLSNTNTITLSQKRFLYNNLDTDSTEYYVPISYTTASSVNPFENTSPSAWLVPGSNLVLNETLATNDWIIVNNQESAYYRVNYDDELWKRVIAVLQSNHSAIHVMNRAQLVDDAFNLARANIITYAQALNVLSYLKNETDYYPWYSAIVGFNFLHRLYGEGSATGQKLISFEKELLEGVLNSVSFTNLNESNQIYSLKLSLILNRACKLGLPSCIQNANEQFLRYEAGSSIDKNLRSVVYCNALRSGNVTQWEFVWNKFVNETGPTEKLVLMSALGCTSDQQNIRSFLNETLNPESTIRQQDLSSAWSAIYTGHPQNILTALEFFIDNHEMIYSSYSSASSILSSLANRITTSAEMTMLRNFQTNSTKIRNDVNSSISSAEGNMNLASERQSEIMQYFEDITSPATTPSTVSTSPAVTPNTVPTPSTLCSTVSSSTPTGSTASPTDGKGGSRMLQSFTLLEIASVIVAVLMFYK